ncbi:MAG: UDP-N-acetylmuramate--L-alanine ligase, partial [Coriobacteriia bacterium]|nr:UDP-N-acetylmuramate--L-alanine ligase [Coriobacteriia bacterium]
TEVAAMLKAASALDFKRVIALFQPHRYSRTRALEREFATSFDGAFKVVLLDVYSAGETPIPGVSGRTICDAILDHDSRAQVTYLPHRKDIVRYLVSQAREGDLIMTIGAGDVTAIGPELVSALTEAAAEHSAAS